LQTSKANVYFRHCATVSHNSFFVGFFKYLFPPAVLLGFNQSVLFSAVTCLAFLSSIEQRSFARVFSRFVVNKVNLVGLADPTTKPPPEDRDLTHTRRKVASIAKIQV
jgi:hypothetical protein